MRIPCLTLALFSLALPALAAPAGHTAESGPGIRWQKSLAGAKAMAARTGKPLFLLHLFGRLDQEFC